MGPLSIYRLVPMYVGSCLMALILGSQSRPAYAFPDFCLYYPCIRFTQFVNENQDICYSHYDLGGQGQKIVRLQALKDAWSKSNPNNDPTKFTNTTDSIWQDHYDQWDYNCVTSDGAVYPRWAACKGKITATQLVVKNICIDP
jgi:hypothetical protein